MTRIQAEVFRRGVWQPMGGQAMQPVGYTGVPLALTWADEFDGAVLDVANWSYGDPHELSQTTDAGPGYLKADGFHPNPPPAEVLDVAGRQLRISARRTPEATAVGKQLSSAVITSQSKVTFTRGWLEARYRMPAGRSLLPAWWSMGDLARPWPERGEVDWHSFLNSDTALGVHNATALFAWDPTAKTYTGYATHQSHRSGAEIHRASPQITRTWHSDGLFHTFTVHRTADFIREYIDGKLLYAWARGELVSHGQDLNATVPPLIFDAPLHLRFDLGVGGAARYRVPAGTAGAVALPSLNDPTVSEYVIFDEGDLVVDYIRMWGTA